MDGIDRDIFAFKLNDEGLPPNFLQNMSREELGVLVDEVREVLDVLDETEGEDVVHLPLMLGGSAHTCCRCGRTTTIGTWRVVSYAANGAARDVCPRCAHADPALRIWQEYADITQAVDGLMQAAPDKETRRQLAGCLRSTADNFSVWRWPEDDQA